MHFKSVFISLTLIIFLVGFAGPNTQVRNPDKNLNCSNKDREYAKFWENYYDPEDAYDFGRKIKHLVKEKNLEGLFALVEGELASGPRKQFIKGKNLSDIFSEDWRNDILTSDPPCSPVGWRGFMLASGSIWFNQKDGKWRVFSIIGARKEDTRESNIPIGWKTPDGLIPPQCFVRQWMSNDNFEEFETKYSIKNRADFRKNPGKYIGDEIPELVPIVPSWGGDRLILATPYDLCLNGSVKGGEVADPTELNVNVYKNSIKSKSCSSKTSCIEYAYSVLANVPPKKCQKLAPHLKGKCRQSFLIAVGDYSGGSMGWDYGYNIYGLFSFKDKRRFIVPLKNFQNKNDAINYIEQSVK